MKALGPRALQDVIVLEVPARRLEIAVALLRRVAIARAKEIVLELGGGERLEVQLAGSLDLPAQDRARRDADKLVTLLVLDVAQHQRALLVAETRWAYSSRFR